jgi:protein-disulfide isomerase
MYVALTKKFYQAPISRRRTRQKPRAARRDDKTVWKVPVDAKDPIRGPADALVTIVEWSDFQCPFCKRVEATMKQIKDSYASDVRVVWKDNPLPFHNRAKPAATLARMAFDLKGEKGFWVAHDGLYDEKADRKTRVSRRSPVRSASPGPGQGAASSRTARGSSERA